jgi:hypothetical protein
MKGASFTSLCRQLTVLRPGRADLHTHTTFSDGTHTPASLVERAIKAGLKAVAVTDHDTTAGVEPARAAAAGGIEVIAGVEVTAEFRGAEIHLLGYFVRPDDEPLGAALRDLRAARRERLLEMARRLKPSGVDVEADVVSEHHRSRGARRDQRSIPGLLEAGDLVERVRPELGEQRGVVAVLGDLANADAGGLADVEDRVPARVGRHDRRRQRLPTRQIGDLHVIAAPERRRGEDESERRCPDDGQQACQSLGHHILLGRCSPAAQRR